MDRPATALGLDIGSVRIGVARALWPDGLASPQTTLDNNESFLDNLEQIIKDENVCLIVAGKPRSLSGNDTLQTDFVDTVASAVKNRTGLPLFYQDEAVTSVKAEEELKLRKKPYSKGDIDALSATYILEDFMNEHPKGAGIEI